MNPSVKLLWLEHKQMLNYRISPQQKDSLIQGIFKDLQIYFFVQEQFLISKSGKSIFKPWAGAHMNLVNSQVEVTFPLFLQTRNTFTLVYLM